MREREEEEMYYHPREFFLYGDLSSLFLDQIFRSKLKMNE